MATPTVLTRSAGRVLPTCCHEDPEMHQEFLPPGAPTSFACSAVATVYVFRPARIGEPEYYAALGAFCDDHAAIQGRPLETVAIADLPLACSGCGAPVWLAHPAEHLLGRCAFCQVSTGADHSSCCCPAEADYLRVMDGA
jgi:hypothetical protein